MNPIKEVAAQKFRMLPYNGLADVDLFISMGDGVEPIQVTF